MSDSDNRKSQVRDNWEDDWENDDEIESKLKANIEETKKKWIQNADRSVSLVTYLVGGFLLLKHEKIIHNHNSFNQHTPYRG